MTNNLRRVRVSQGVLQSQAASGLQLIDPRIDAAMVSRYENGVCLPTVQQLEQLENMYQTDRTKMYNIEDLDLLGIGKTETAPAGAKTSGRSRDRRSRQYFRKCFRISRSFEESLPDDLLERTGYASWQSWFDGQMRRLLAEYQAAKRGG